MAEVPPELSSAYANGAISHYGSERLAAAALGVKRSTLHDASIGRSTLSAANRGKIASLPTGAFHAVERAAGLIRTVAGADPTAQKAESKQLAAQERRAPGSTRAVADQFQRSQQERRLSVWGEPLDSLDRPIRAKQAAAYDDLLAQYNAGTLSAANYKRFREYQDDLAGGGPSSSSSIEPL